MAQDRRPRTGTEKRQRKHRFTIRCDDEEHAAIVAAADRAGLSIGAFLRHQGTGKAGPRAVRRPPVELRELARLLAAVGMLGSNVNQQTRIANSSGDLPALRQLMATQAAVMEIRDALMKALWRDR